MTESAFGYDFLSKQVFHRHSFAIMASDEPLTVCFVGQRTVSG
jgi:hypothetical protein